MRQDKGSPLDLNKSLHGDFAELTAIPGDALRRAIQNDLDSLNPILLSVEDSQIAIGLALRESMSRLDIGVYQLHEKTGLSCEFIHDMMNDSGDLSDSEPLRKLELTLGVKLCHL